MINDLDNSGEASNELAMGKEDDAADFDEAPLGGGDFDFCHGGVAAIHFRQYIQAWL